MTIPEEDIDDFEFDEDFAEEWDDDVSPEDSFLESDDDTSITSDVQNDSRTKVTKSKKGGVYTASIFVTVLIAAGGYFLYSYFLSAPQSIPVIQISSKIDYSADNDKNSGLSDTENLSQNYAQADPIIIDTPVTEDESSHAFNMDGEDGVLTPLPDNIENIDISLASLSNEDDQSDFLPSSDDHVINTQDVPQDGNIFENFNTEEVSSTFDEQKMLEKTEISPSDEESVSFRDDQDIFDHIENIAPNRDEADRDATINPENVDTSSPELTTNTLPVSSFSNIEMPVNSAENNSAAVNSSMKELEETKPVVIQNNTPPVNDAKNLNEDNAQPEAKPIERVKKNWKIKAIQPGKAIIKDTATDSVKSVEIGEHLYEIGLITDIEKRNGKWVIIGKTGVISQ